MKLPFLRVMFWCALFLLLASVVMAGWDIAAGQWWYLMMMAVCIPVNGWTMAWYRKLIRKERSGLTRPNYAEIRRLEREVFGRD